MSTQFRSDDTVKWWLGFGNGSDGDYSSAGNATDAPVDSSCSGSANSTSLSATNASFAAGKPVLIHQTRGTGAGNWELNQIQSYTSGTITLKKALQNTYTDSGASQAQVIQLKQYKNFTQNSGHTLTAKAWDGNVGGIIAFLAKGTATITGTLSATGKGFRGGTGKITSSTGAGGNQGEGTAGAGSVSKAANGNGGGGGVRASGNSYNNGAGGGGYGAAGQDCQYGTASNKGLGGAAAGAAGMTATMFGGGGGGGQSTSGTASTGGSGGGLVLIISKNVTVGGTITTNGNNASNAADGAGGGGAGGGILVKARTSTLGTTKLTATGGNGDTVGDGVGGAGAVGRIHIDYSGSYTGTTSPTLDSTLDPTIKGVSPNNMFLAF